MSKAKSEGRYWDKRTLEELIIKKLSLNPWSFPGIEHKARDGLTQTMDSIQHEVKLLATDADLEYVRGEMRWRSMFRNIVKVENENNEKGALAEGVIAYLGNGRIVPGAHHDNYDLFMAVEALCGLSMTGSHPVQIGIARVIKTHSYALLSNAERAIPAVVKKPPPAPIKKAEPPEKITDTIDKMRAESIEDSFERLSAKSRNRVIYDLTEKTTTKEN